jgi:hypothetical protein
MKKSLFAFGIVLLFISAGCNSTTCDNGAEMDVLEIFYTDYEDLQTVTIEGYKKGSNFTELKDASYKIIGYNEIDTMTHIFDCRLNKKISGKLDYKITIQADNTVCYLTDINVKDELCYDGMFVKKYSKKLDGYYVNGGLFACQVLKVFFE